MSHENNHPVIEPANVKIIVTKMWCDKTLSPMAWTRLVVRNLNIIRLHDFTFDDLKSPGMGTKVNKSVYAALLSSVGEVYGESQLSDYQQFIKKLLQKHQNISRV